jgi:hypothetical protein
MFDYILYVVWIGMFISIVLGILSGNALYKFRLYVHNHYPEREKEITRNSFAYGNSFYKKDNITDPTYIKLKTRARKLMSTVYIIGFVTIATVLTMAILFVSRH